MDPSSERAEALEYISTHLLLAAALLTRLLAREAAGPLSRSEAGILRSLLDGPRRITELAALEGIAQPTATLLVKSLEQQGLVRRERQRSDQRVVLVSVSAAGRRAFERLRADVEATLRTHLEHLPDERLATLATATTALDELNTALQRDLSSAA